MTGSGPSERLPRNRRVPVQRLPGMRLTERDRQIVLLVYDYRAVTAEIVNIVLFPSGHEQDAPVSSRCLHRLKLLYHHGYLIRHPMAQGRSSFVYTLDQRGATLVAEMLKMPSEELDWSSQDNQMVRGPFIDHLLLINGVRAALEVGARAAGAAVANWQDDKAIRRTPISVKLPLSQSGQQVELIPDGTFYLIRDKKQATACFLELDRGTETVRSTTGVKDWTGKVRAYLALAGTRPLRVLAVVAAGERRLASLRETAAKMGDRGVFHFALYDQAAEPALAVAGRIWRRSSGGALVALLS